MKQKKIILFGGTVLLTGLTTQAKEIKQKQQPNIIFIAIDDLNDWIGCLGVNHQALTPNIDRLASKGMLFTNAFCCAPGSSPSRNALLTGKEPFSTGYYPFYENWDNDKEFLPGYVTLPQYFRENGYYTYASGKIHHNMAGQNPKYGQRDWTENNWTVIRNLPNLRVNPKERVYFDKETNKWESGPILNPIQDHPDYQTALYGINLLKKPYEHPFFIALGFLKPHLPFLAPKKYFDLFNRDSIQFPPIKDDDLDDVPWAGRSNAKIELDNLIRKKRIRKGMIQGYLACTAFIDDMIGNVMNALQKSPYKDNTIIVLWGDNGFHFGEKRSFTKFSLWDESTRIPFIIVDPRMKELHGEKCNRAVSLINVYPTLVEMCGLPKKNDLDGTSLVPLLKNPTIPWERPALTTWGRGNYVLSTEDWRYIRYFDGTEELYNHQNDPNEWTNVADNQLYKNIKEGLKKWFPTKEAKLMPNGILEPIDADKPYLTRFKEIWKLQGMK